MRDMFTHKITTPEHWNMLMMPTVYTLAELDYDLVVGDREVTPSYDPHCSNGDVTDGCAPKAVISAEKLRDYTEGPLETAKIANTLHNDARMGQYVIAQEAWDCIWEELIQKGKGLKTVYQRPGFIEDNYNFSAEMLMSMVQQLDRLIGKYGGSEWNTKETANRIVELLVEHRALVQTELNEVTSGMRKLGEKDFLGPKERRRMLKAKEKEEQEEEKQQQQLDNVGDGKAVTKKKKKRKLKDSNQYFDRKARLANAQKKRKRRDMRRQRKEAKNEGDAAP